MLEFGLCHPEGCHDRGKQCQSNEQSVLPNKDLYPVVTLFDSGDAVEQQVAQQRKGKRHCESGNRNAQQENDIDVVERSIADTKRLERAQIALDTLEMCAQSLVSH